MKHLHYTRRRVAFRVSADIVQAGIICGHYVRHERSYFTGEYRWNRYYSLRVISGPSSVRGTVVQAFAGQVFRWPFVREPNHK